MFCLTERTMKRPQSEQAAAVSTNKDQTRTILKKQKRKARKYELFVVQMVGRIEQVQVCTLHYNKNRNTPRFPRSITVLVSADGGT